MIYASENPRHRAFYRFSRNNYEANIIIDLKTYQLFYLSIYKPFGYLFVRIYVYIYIAGTFWTRISMKMDYKTGTTVRNTKVRPVFAFVDAVTTPVEKLFLTLCLEGW